MKLPPYQASIFCVPFCTSWWCITVPPSHGGWEQGRWSSTRHPSRRAESGGSGEGKMGIMEPGGNAAQGHVLAGSCCLWQMLQPFTIFQTQTECRVFSHIFRLSGNIVKTKMHRDFETSILCKIFFPFLPATPTTVPWQLLLTLQTTTPVTRVPLAYGWAQGEHLLRV